MITVATSGQSSEAARRFAPLPPYEGDPIIVRIYRLPLVEISYLTNQLEACEGMGLLRTLDRTRGIIECWIAPDRVEEFDLLIESSRKQFPIQDMDKDFD